MAHTAKNTILKQGLYPMRQTNQQANVHGRVAAGAVTRKPLRPIKARLLL
ncbi:hypothetical protein LWM68_43455 [Niabella sp. W65]|nr:hypothetical protein [Niabella sp. W65]MCH7368991.1 hypothetical protein [Niabella sp. W65]ULT44562.1 hypothetical protein KRR40_15190 [Niabella sp. I65]